MANFKKSDSQVSESQLLFPAKLEAGKTIQGVFNGSRDINMKGFDGTIKAQTVHDFETKEGKVTLVGTARLNEKLMKKSKGQDVLVVYMGKRDAKTKDGKSYQVHEFSVSK